MGYIGKALTKGAFRLITLGASFNGSTTAFTMSEAAGNANNLIVILGGVLQHWGEAYTVSGTTITFSSAPATSTTIKILKLGDTYDMGQAGSLKPEAVSGLTNITTLADADEFLVHDATDNQLKAVVKSSMPAGTWTQLATATASSVSSIVLSGISSSYKRYRIECTSVVPATDATELRMTLSANADGSSPITSAYYWSLGLLYSNNSSNSYSSVNAENDAQFQLNYDQGSASGEALDVTIYTGDLNSSSLYKNVWWDGAGYYIGNNAEGVSAGGHLRNTTSFSSCVFTFSSGNITSGLFRLYGMV